MSVLIPWIYGQIRIELPLNELPSQEQITYNFQMGIQLKCVSKHENGIPSLIMFMVLSDKSSYTAMKYIWVW
jgi:hypothetical protein